VRVLVFGGSDRKRPGDVSSRLDQLRERGLSVVIEGGRRGAERFAREWAAARRVPCIEHPINWHADGGTPEYVQQQSIIDLWQPDIALLYRESEPSLVQDMERRARLAGIRCSWC
jgi:hypothetical protein